MTVPLHHLNVLPAASIPLETAPAVLEIGMVLLLAVGAGWLARRVGLPAVLGYLAVGLLVSPFTPGYVADRGQLQVLADVGVVLLLFEVGIEVNPLRLGREHRAVLLAAPAQVLITTLATGGVALLLGVSFAGSALIGLSIALSSSVVVVNITRSRRRTTNPATEATLLSWSVMQDMSGVAFALVLLAGIGLADRPPLTAAAFIIAFVVLVALAAWALPRILDRLHGEHDLFLLLSVGSGLALAGLGARYFGVPLALAAFVAGLAVGESPAAAEARRRILPFRDLFAVLFFVSLGSLVDPLALIGALPWLAFLVVAVVIAKVLPVLLLSRLAQIPEVRPWQLAIGLGQIGEFSFVLASIVLGRALIPAELYNAVLVAVVLTIAVSTTLVRLGHRPSLAAAT
ncbi:MAG: monovalent cation:H+ antiporter-2, family [Chloroflexota bacterium]|nr:monovalent cation:H+ antiporter-2, family [Chloroflexota bacterium]